MDETTKRALIKTTDMAIKQARAELDRLQHFRSWVLNVGTPAIGGVTAVGEPVEPPVEQKTTADYIIDGFALIGPHAALTVPEILAAAREVGWTTDSGNPEQEIRITIGSMDSALVAVPPTGTNEQRRFAVAK